MARLQRTNFGTPERTRDLGRGRMDVVDVDETAVGRMTLQPACDGSALTFEERGVHEMKGLSGARPVSALTRVAAPAAR